MIIYHCPVNNAFIGGIRILYNHVDLLNKNNIPAAIMHNSRDGFRVSWFPNNTKVIYQHQYQLEPEDILVVPEVYEPEALAGVPKIVFNQNFYLSKEINHEHKAILAISHQNAKLIRAKFPHLKVRVVNWSLPEEIYHYDDTVQKTNTICYFNRKRTDHLQHLMKVCRRDGWTFQELRGSDAEVAQQMRQAKIFLQAGDQEGCPRPPAEAMACGCVVVGYTGGGGEDYMLPDYSYPVETLNLAAFEAALNLAMASDDLLAKGQRASASVLATYSRAKEEAILVQTWEELLASPIAEPAVAINDAGTIHLPRRGVVDPLVINNFNGRVESGLSDAEKFAYHLQEAQKWAPSGSYLSEGLFTWGKNNSLFEDTAFRASWARHALIPGKEGEAWGRYLLICAASHCLQVPGDFVECGIQDGSAIRTLIDYFGRTVFDRTFWALTPFDPAGRADATEPGGDPQPLEDFPDFPQVRHLAGPWLASLAQRGPQSIAYLHLDLPADAAPIPILDCALPLVSPGGMIILNNYEVAGDYRRSKLLMDAWFRAKGYLVWPLPTGQGFVLKK